MYNPLVPRFWSVDRLADVVPGMTPYRYAFNNPLSFTDPTGMLEDDKKLDFTYSDGYSTLSSRNSTGSVGFDGIYNAVGGGDPPKKKGGGATSTQSSNSSATTTLGTSGIVGGAAALQSEALTLGQWLSRFVSAAGAFTVAAAELSAGIIYSMPIILQGDVSSTQKTAIDVVSGSQKRNQRFVTIFKAPQTAAIASELQSVGFLPENFPRQLPYMDGNAYFAGPKSRELAMEYAKIYGAGILQVTIPQKVYQSVFKPLERSYQGTKMTELPIPREFFPLLNTFPRKLTAY